MNSMAIVVATHAVPKNLEGERDRTDSVVGGGWGEVRVSTERLRGGPRSGARGGEGEKRRTS